MKKLVSFLLAVVISVITFTMFVSADGVSAKDINSSKKSSILTISGTTATCKSSFKDSDSNIYSVTAVQTLEKHWALGIFNAVSGANWTKTVYTSNLSMTNTKSSLSSGTYRLRTDFTVTTANGQSETITVYSSEKTIP